MHCSDSIKNGYYYCLSLHVNILKVNTKLEKRFEWHKYLKVCIKDTQLWMRTTPGEDKWGQCGTDREFVRTFLFLGSRHWLQLLNVYQQHEFNKRSKP